MDYLISWVASAVGGFLSVVFLVIGWGAIPASIMAVIGAIRRRCPWYVLPMYLLLIPIGTLLFRGVFWVLERVAQPDALSTTLFWGAVFFTGLGALFSAGPTLLKEIWQITNGRAGTGQGGIAKNALSVLGTIIAFVVIGAVMKSVVRAPRERDAISKGEKFMEQLQADATRKHPDIPISQAMRQESSERATQKLTSETDELKRTNIAADMFWGFFFLNTRERPEFCREQGVDIQPFVKAFELAHKNEIAKARSIYARASVDEKTLHTAMKPQIRKALFQDMNDIATSTKSSLKEVCQVFSEKTDAIAQEMHISKVQPMVFKVLASAK